jgi:hypothetical protein
MCVRSLCHVKGWEERSEIKYALREGASAVAVAVSMDAVMAVGRRGGEARRVLVRERKELLAEGV